ncbi:uncharacterized protein LOC126780414 [Nymphalis io]|uniref:uncharacterized protein LOC126780414 n=1 Tax=Inachis io TaxID=171585 RepID=UPI00216A1449|nr:uncharacterized protein LOC126780414 [Nymphalis io]
MLKYCEVDSDAETYRRTMSGESELEISVYPEPHGESPPEEGSAQPTDDMSKYAYDQVIADSLAENMYNLSVESDLDDDDGDFSPYASSRGPPLPFVLSDYLGIDAEESDIDYKISKIEGLEHMVVNSPLWYIHVRPHLTFLERQELWDRTPWAVKFYWDDSDNAGADDDDPAAPPLYTDQYYNDII